MQITFNCGNKLCRNKIVCETNLLDMENPQVLCKNCGQYSLIPKNYLSKIILENENRILEERKTIVAFLVVHDEHTVSQTFTLKTGKNIIGRKDEDKPCDIMIETDDSFMSRNHCIIETRIDRSGSIRLLLNDYGSLNGTYLNGSSTRLGKDDKVYLEDGDTMQLGKTKVVVKLLKSSKDAEEARKNVLNLPFSKTVVVEKK